MILMVLAGGYLSDRIGRKALNVIAALLGQPHHYHHGFTAIRPYSGAAGIIGIGMGIFNSTNWALATVFARRRKGPLFGRGNMATSGGAVLARAIGPAIDFSTARQPTGATISCSGHA
jgi:MFS family permease